LQLGLGLVAGLLFGKFSSNRDDRWFGKCKCCAYLILAVTVPVYCKQADKKRNYRKVDVCLFCKKKFVSKIRMHYLNIHADKERVADIVLKPISLLDRQASYFKFIIIRWRCLLSAFIVNPLDYKKLKIPGIIATSVSVFVLVWTCPLSKGQVKPSADRWR
jgi:hypothetical protein